jgi:hypothetical protein
MAIGQTYFNNVNTHYFQIDTTVTGGMTSPVFTRNFRVLDATVFVVTPVPGAVLAIYRLRGGVVSLVSSYDVSASGRGVITSDIDQSNGLFESGDQLYLVSSAGADALVTNVIIYLQQFSL